MRLVLVVRIGSGSDCVTDREPVFMVVLIGVGTELGGSGCDRLMRNDEIPLLLAYVS